MHPTVFQSVPKSLASEAPVAPWPGLDSSTALALGSLLAELASEGTGLRGAQLARAVRAKSRGDAFLILDIFEALQQRAAWFWLGRFFHTCTRPFGGGHEGVTR